MNDKKELKLTLNKQAVLQLTDENMSMLRGGNQTVDITCDHTCMCPITTATTDSQFMDCFCEQ